MATSGLCKVSGRILKIGTSDEQMVLPDTVDFSQFEKGIVALPGDNDPIAKLIREYGETPFYSSVAAVNAFFLRPETRLLIKEETQPILYRRIQSETIFTPIEVANFTIGMGYTPYTLSVATTVISINFINQFESFYTQNFTKNTIGSFCSILPNIFGAVGAFFTALQTLDSTIQSLKNFALNFSLGSLLTNLKNSILSIIDSVVFQVKSIIENLSLTSVSSTSVQQQAVVNEQILSNFHKTKTSALSFFDQQNVDNYKTGIEKLIDYAMSLFKNPTIQEVQFLLYRFCSFASLIENAISSLKNPVQSYISSYTGAVSILQSTSSVNTARAISAGAVRYDIQDRKTDINNGNELYENAGNAPPLTADDYKDITPWNDGKGDSRVTFVGNSFFDPMIGRDGWDKVNPKVKARLMKVQKAFGKQLKLVSGYRSREYNDRLRAQGKKAAKNSLHIAMLALDVKWDGFNKQSMEEFIAIALKNDFTGIGRYDSFVHIDIGPRREWRG